MPNYVTNELKAAPAVIKAALNENGLFDFNKVLKSPCPVGEDWEGINIEAEMIVKQIVGKPSHFGLGKVSSTGPEIGRRIKALDDETFEQLIGMLRNWKACDFLHEMDFARSSWGTKWNALGSAVDAENGTVRFDTAWSCPIPVFEALSEMFPQEVLTVTYADEDIGSNCGTVKLQNGVVIESDAAPRWDSQTTEEKKKWRTFAYNVKGYGEPPEDELDSDD